MKPIDPNRRALFDDLFPIPENQRIAPLRNVLDAVQRAKASRRRRRSLVGVVSGFVFAGLITLAPLGNDAKRTNGIQRVTAGTTAASTPLSPDFVTIERVDDEGLLRLLADTPSALVQFDDGRRGLILVVHTSSSE